MFLATEVTKLDKLLDNLTCLFTEKSQLKQLAKYLIQPYFIFLHYLTLQQQCGYNHIFLKFEQIILFHCVNRLDKKNHQCHALVKH